jgi:CHASE2 domain-containing sensor protein
VALSLAAGVTHPSWPAFLSGLDNLLFDTLVKWTPPPARLSFPLSWDSTTRLLRFGRWPWPRLWSRRLLDRLAALGPASVGVDVLFPESSVPEGERGRPLRGPGPGEDPGRRTPFVLL